MDLDKIYETIHLYASSESDSDYDGLDDFDDEYLKNRPNPIAIEEITKKLVVITPGGAGTVNKEPNDSTLSIVQEPLCYLTDRSPSELTSDEFTTLNAALEALGQFAGVTVEISRDDSKIDVVLKMLNLLKHLNGLGKVGRGFYDVLDILGMQPVYFVVDEDSLKDIATWLQSINLKITWGNFSMDQDDGCNIINNLRLMYHYLEETPKSKLVKQVLDSLVEVYENVGKFVDATSIGDITEDEVCEEYSVLLNMLKSINNKTVLGTFFSDSEDVVQIKADMEDIYELILAIDDGYLKHRMVKIFLETYNNFARLILGKYLWVLKDCPNVESLDIVENCTGVKDMEVTKNHPKVNVSGNHIKLFEKKAKSIMEKKNSKNLDYDLWLCLDDIAKEKIQSSINQYKKEYNIDINIYTDSFEMLKKKLNDFNNTVRKVGDKQLIQLHMKLKMSIKTKIWWCALNKLLMGNRPKFFNYFLFKDHQKKTLNNHLKIINNVTGINVDVLSDSYEVFVKKLEDIELRLKDFPAHLSTFYLLKDELDKVPNTISKMYSDCAHNSVKNPKTQIVSKKNVYPNFEYLTVGQKNNIQNMLREISKVAQCKLDVNSSYDKFVTNMTSLKNFVGNMGSSETKVNYLKRITNVENSLRNSEGKVPVQTDVYPNFKSLTKGQKQNIQQMLQAIMDETKCTVDINKNDHATFIANFQRMKHSVQMMKQSNEKQVYLRRLKDVEKKLGGIKAGVTIANLSGCTSVESLNSCGITTNQHLDFKSLSAGQKQNIQQMLQKIMDVTKCTFNINKCDHKTFIVKFQRLKHCVEMMKQSNEKLIYLKRLEDVEHKLGGIYSGVTIANLSGCTSVESLDNCGVSENLYQNDLSLEQKQNIQLMWIDVTYNIKKCDHKTLVANFERMKHCMQTIKPSIENDVFLDRLKEVEQILGRIKPNCGVSENLYPNFESLTKGQKHNIQQMLQKIVDETKCTLDINKNDYAKFVANFKRLKHCVQMMKQSNEKLIYLKRLEDVEHKLGGINSGVTIANISGCTSVESLDNCGVSENLYPNFKSLTKGQKHNIQQMLQKIVDESKCTLDINKNDYATFVANFKRLKHCVQMMKQSNKKLSYLMRLEDVERKLGVIKTGVPRGTIANLSGCTSVESLDNCELSENLYQNFKPVERLYPNFYTLTEGDKQRIEELLKEINKATNTKVTVNSSLREFSDGMVEIKSLVGNMEFTFSKYVCLNNIENIERILDQCNVNWGIKRTEPQKTTAVVHQPDNQVIGDRTVNRIKICDTTTADYNSVSRQENTMNFVENLNGIVKRVDKVVRQQNNDNYIENVHGKDNIDQLHNNGNYIENLVLNQENKVVDQLQSNDNHVYIKQQNIQGILNEDNHNNVSTILYMSEKSFKSYKSLTQSDADNINSLLKEIDQHIAIQVNRDDYFTFLTSLNVLIDKVRAMETSTQKTKYLQNLTTVEQKICKVSTTNQFKLRNGAIVEKNVPIVEKYVLIVEKNAPIVEKNAPIVEKNAPIVDKEAAILELTPNQKNYISNCLGDINRVIKIKSDINIDSDTYFGFLSKFHAIKRNVDKMLQTNQKKMFVRDITVIEHLLGLGAGGKSAHLKHPQHEELRQEEKREQQRNEQECDEEQQQEVGQHELQQQEQKGQQQLTQKHKQLEQKHEQQQLEHKRKGQQLEQQQELKHEKQQHEQQQQESKEQLTQTHAQQQHEQKHEEQQNEQQQQELKREEQPQELEHENHQQEQKHEQQRHEQKHEEQQNEQQQEDPKHEEQPQELEHEKQQPKPEQQQKHQDFLLFQYYNLNKSQRKYINTLCKTVDANLDVTKDDYFTFIKKLTATNSFFLDAVRNTLRNVKIPSASSNLDPSVTQREVIQHKLIKLNAILPINVLDFSELNSNMITIKTMLKNDTIITQSNKIMVAKYVAEIDEILTNKQPPKTSIALLFIRYRNFLSSDDLSPEDFTNESTVQTKKINNIILLNTINKFECKIETVEGLCNQFYMLSRIIEDKINNSPGGLDLLWIGFNSLKSAFVDEIEESKTFLSCLSKNPCRKTERRVLQNLAVLNETLDHMREFQEKFPNKYVGKLR